MLSFVKIGHLARRKDNIVGVKVKMTLVSLVKITLMADSLKSVIIKSLLKKKQRHLRNKLAERIFNDFLNRKKHISKK